MDMVRSIMSIFQLLESIWGEELRTTAFILKRIPSKSIPKMPFELYTGKTPKLGAFVFEVV